MKYQDYELTLEIETDDGQKLNKSFIYNGYTKSKLQRQLRLIPISNDARIILTKAGKVTIYAPDEPDWREKVTYTIKALTPTHLSQHPLENA